MPFSFLVRSLALVAKTRRKPLKKKILNTKKVNFQTLLDIKWFINLFYRIFKKNDTKNVYFLILNFNIEFKCNTKYVLSLIHLSQSLFFLFLLWQYVQLGRCVVCG